MSVQATFCATLVDEWTRLGVTDAVVCPGSRSTPLALPLAQWMRTHVRLDERSAAFYAIGLAKATQRPVVICVTSGTAAAELHPAVAEAHHARVPLLVCTADRPPELHHTGASQTIEQDALFAAEVRWRSDPGVPVAGQEATWRPLAVRAFVESRFGERGPGPVHLNLAFREPLTDGPDELPAPRAEQVIAAGGQGAVGEAVETLRPRGLVIVGGPSYGPVDPIPLVAFAERRGWPVLADPLSGCRVGGTIAAADAVARTHPDLPETIVLLGAPWLSKALGDYVVAAASVGARIVVIDPWRHRPDPLRVATDFVHADPDAWLEVATAAEAPLADPDWLPAWRSMDERAQRCHRRDARHRIERAPGGPGLVPPCRGGRRRGLRLGLHADPRSRVVRARPARTAGRVGQPRGQRDRRLGLDGARRGGLGHGATHAGPAGGPGVPP